jgi:hypothetical protein
MAQTSDLPTTKLIFEELRAEMRRLHKDLAKQIEQSGERLLQAFLAIAIPIDLRMTQTENDLASIRQRLAAAESRISEVDRRVPPE